PKAVTGVVPVNAVRPLSGLEFITALSEGRFPKPPIAVLMDFQPVEVERGRVVFAATPGEQHYNPLGSVHGGYISTLLDSCMGCAVHTQLGPGQGYTSLELKVNFVRRVSAETGPVRAEGKVIHVGGQVATAEGRLVDADNRLLAHGTTTCLVFRLPDGPK
ncbi:MAG: PaaI family thioesterase, partial [Roseiarcus sp.]